MKKVGLILLGTAMGMSAGITAMTVAQCPKVKRTCRMMQRKMTSYMRRIGL